MTLHGQLVPRLQPFEGQTVMLRARLAGLEGTLLTIAATSAITWNVYDLTSATPTIPVATNSGTVTIGNVITNTPSTADWPFENTGWNFTLGLPAGSGSNQVPWKAGRRYEVVVTVTNTLTSGPGGAWLDGPFKLVWAVAPRPMQQAG